jgi:hypothetical protein
MIGASWRFGRIQTKETKGYAAASLPSQDVRLANMIMHHFELFLVFR